MDEIKILIKNQNEEINKLKNENSEIEKLIENIKFKINVFENKERAIEEEKIFKKEEEEEKIILKNRIKPTNGKDITLYLKNLKGNIYTISINTSEDIKKLKEKLINLDNSLDIRKIKLLFNYKLLENYKFLSDYNLENKNVINIINI